MIGLKFFPLKKIFIVLIAMTPLNCSDTMKWPRPPSQTKESWSLEQRKSFLIFLKTKPEKEEIFEYIGKPPDKVKKRLKSPIEVGGDYSHGIVAFMEIPTDGSWTDYYFKLYEAKYYHGDIGERGFTFSHKDGSDEYQWELAPW